MLCTQQLRDDFDRGAEMALSPETGVHDVATLLKEFFRDLPEPIFPKDMQAALLTIHSKSVCKKRTYLVCKSSPKWRRTGPTDYNH